MVGFPGFHRLYMKKYNIGTALRFIPGLGHILALFDLITIPSQIREINLQNKYHEALYERGGVGAIDNELAALKERKETPERIILRTAKKNKGIVTPGEAALEGNISLQEAKKYLDELAAKGFSELRVKQSGVVVYAFPEFMDHGEDEKLLDI
jgi:predicted transcriptional regulator